MKIDSNNNYLQQQQRTNGLNPEVAKANKPNNSVFQIDVNALDSKTKQFWNTGNYDADGDGKISTGDFDSNTLNLSNGSKTFKEFISDLFGKSWDVAGGIINNVKAMFIKSNPNYNDAAKQAEEQRSKDCAQIIKDKKLKVGDTFEYKGQKYSVGYNGTVIGMMSDVSSKKDHFGSGVVRESSSYDDTSNTTIKQNGKTVVTRTDYDNGAGMMKIYNEDGSQTKVHYSAPKSPNDKPHISF